MSMADFLCKLLEFLINLIEFSPSFLLDDLLVETTLSFLEITLTDTHNLIFRICVYKPGNFGFKK